MRNLKTIYYSNPIIKRLINGSFWNLFGGVLSKGVVLISTILIAQIVGKEAYGEYSIIRSTILMFIALASVGVGSISTKYIAQYRDRNITHAYNIYIVSNLFSITCGIIIATLVIVFSDYIAIYQLDAPHLSNPIKYGAILLFFCTINGVQAGTLSGFEDFKSLAKNNSFSSVLELFAILLGVYYRGIEGAIVGSGIAYMILAVMNSRCIRKHFPQSRVRFKNINFSDLKIIIEFGIPAALSNLIVIYALWQSRIYLIKLTDFGEIAIYNAADQIKSFILFIPATLSQIILPMLTNLYSHNDINSYKKTLRYNVILNVGIALILAIVICILSPYILGLWGKDFIETKPLIYLALSTIVASFATVIGQAIASRGKMWIGFLCNLIWAGLVLSLSHIFVNRGMGASGLALAILLSYIVHGIYQYVYLQYVIKHIVN